MPQIESDSISVPADKVRVFAAACFERLGLKADDAHLVADSLVESNLRGIDSHGVARLLHYANRIKHGSIETRPKIRFSKLSPSLGKIDGGHGLGQLAMHRATGEAIQLSKESGSAWVAVENSTHCGALAYYGLQVAREGMLSIVFTHADSMVVPYAGKHAFCGTNPICIAAPGATEESTMCLDMATSVVPWNTVANAAIEGVSIPDHWGVDAEGMATTDPEKVRGVRAFGEYKGSGLGLMIEVFCCMLMGSPFGPHIAPMYGDPTQRRHLGGLVGVIDVRRFRDLDAFRESIARLGQEWNAQERVDETQPVLFPGQKEIMTREQHLRDGIPLGVKVCEAFHALGEELNVRFAL